ncbi:hypothetical protein [Microbulbifer magnicolonia]|uniref:hypothetical protein n=1 Tax=Microbulbifer magnicolonia TaxID=3109744 RepID=UPI002B4062EB|nr:hypothetical protein [Microbulbifer sp. GG15]
MSYFILPVVALAVVAMLFRPALQNLPLWRATLTPLASIIGSGFLISGPLLTHIVEVWAPLAMLGILLAAFAIGAVIRFNIIYAEPLLAGRDRPTAAIALQRISDLALGFAYIVSVAFYLRLFASFVARIGSFRDAAIENALTTAVLLFIAAVGWLRGLAGLEKMEEAAVVVKLGIIAALLLGLAEFDMYWLAADETLVIPGVDLSGMERLRLLAGLLLIVQGFETSRYLGKAYDQPTRVRSMRNAQLIASAVYLLFVMLGLPLLLAFHGIADETAIITLAERVAAILPAMIVVAAVMSQFSAAVADTAGGGGLFNEVSGGRISPRKGYLCLIITAIILVWTANVFEIVTLASRIFALYYLLQCLVAIAVCVTESSAGSKRHLLIPAISAMAILLALVVIFAIPVA